MSLTTVNVGIADIKVARHPDRLTTVLGSCVAICLFDKKKKIAGIAHIMMPEMKSQDENPRKYADSALPILLKEMEDAGASIERINAKIVGGAEVLKFTKFPDFAKIGLRNVEKVKDILKGSSITIVSEDTGGESGRNIILNPATGEVEITILNGEKRSI